MYSRIYKNKNLPVQAKIIFSLTLLYIFALTKACLLKQIILYGFKNLVPLDQLIDFAFLRKLFSVCCLLFYLSGLPLSVLAGPNKQINSINLSNEKVQLNKSGGQAPVTSFYLDADTKGNARFVVDLKETELIGKAYRNSLANGVVVRVNQFSTSPMVVRLVLDGPKDEIKKYAVLDNANSQVLLGKSSKVASSSDSKKTNGVSTSSKTNASKTASVQSISFNNKQFFLETSEAVSLKTFELTVQKKKMFVIDITKAQLTGGLKSNFSEKETGTSEIIRVAQFEPGTVRVVVEGPEAGFWKNELKDSQKIYLSKNAGSNTSSSASKEAAKEEKEKGKKETSPETKDKTSAKHRIYLEGDSPLQIKIKAENAQKSISYKTFRLNAPERLIVDLYNWEGDLKDLTLDSTQLKTQSPLLVGLRTGRPYDSSNKNSGVARLVFDLGQKDLKVQDVLTADKQLLTFTLAPGMSNAFNENLNELKKVRKKLKVVVDAGHGGYDAGAIYSGVEEKNLTLSMTKKLGTILSAADIEVVQTREDDRFVSLDERVNITRKTKPDLFVSIHCNAMESTSKIHGIESYYFTPQSRNLAHVLHKKVVKKTKAPDRFVRKARFVVIRETAIPSVLLEVGFMSNPTERSQLMTKDYQNTIAKAVAEGIVEYLAEIQTTTSSTAKSGTKR
ncbi:MAG: N-acetylmuramoyl-L-alanine amidase [Candidatus Caenarcaniphilales bacterium]|nr:N-acetylmuramoyl-L-alanine amidase [Candidatus Caenarcaniphilales bacterium]